MKLRSSLNPEEQTNLVDGPTTYKKGPNKSQLVCGLCNEIYYVDDETFRHAITAIEEGFDEPFCCEECEVEYDELSH